jgi:hypothetical protein
LDTGVQCVATLSLRLYAHFGYYHGRLFYTKCLAGGSGLLETQRPQQKGTTEKPVSPESARGIMCAAALAFGFAGQLVFAIARNRKSR